MVKHADYGLDRPDFLIFLAVAGAVLVLLGALRFLSNPYLGYLIGLVLWGFAGFFVYGSKVSKPRDTERFLNSLQWTGDERVLDIGCGRGVLLINVAKHLSTGRAVGIDIWSKNLQSGNSPVRTLENAKLEGVADRVDLKDGDARTLPFESASFDLVLTSLVFHHIPPQDRRHAFNEAIRVLRPGGRMIMREIFHADEYALILAEFGMTQINVSQAKFPPPPPFQLRTVVAVKPK